MTDVGPMTPPAEQRALYETASTVQDVVRLLNDRGLTNEAGYINALHPMILANPVQAFNTIRGLADEHDRTIVDVMRRAGNARIAADRADLERRAEARKRQAAGLRWAATALTRGMAFGTLQPSEEHPKARAELRRRVAIVGARAHENEEQVRAFVATLHPDTIVVSGGAAGVDTFAENAARARGLGVEIYKPDWTKGRGAGFARNKQIVDASDEIHAFLWGESRGTMNTVEQARRAGKPVTIYEPTPVSDPEGTTCSKDDGL